jgi:6-phosphogluconolactonase
LKAIQTLSTIPADYGGANTCAKIGIHPEGRFVYVSNRGHDSLAAFAFDPASDRISPLGNTPTEATPRGFDIDPRGRFLIAAGQSSGKLVVYRIGPSGQLRPVETYEVGLRPWWVTCVQP